MEEQESSKEWNKTPVACKVCSPSSFRDTGPSGEINYCPAPNTIDTARTYQRRDMNEGSSCFLVPVTAVCPLQKEDPRGEKKQSSTVVLFSLDRSGSTVHPSWTLKHTDTHTQTHLRLSGGRETTAVALQQLFLIYYKVRWPQWYAETSHVSLCTVSISSFAPEACQRGNIKGFWSRRKNI